MEQKFIILSRYECWKSGGKTFCDWFVKDNTPMTKEEAESTIEEMKNLYNYIDKKTKLKHEYKLQSYDEYMKNDSKLQKVIEENKKQNAEYYKSAEYKELQKKKRLAKKELKEKQKKYIEEHTKPAN